jgi:hypothetical protein
LPAAPARAYDAPWGRAGTVPQFVSARRLLAEQVRPLTLAIGRSHGLAAIFRPAAIQTPDFLVF